MAKLSNEAKQEIMSLVTEILVILNLQNWQVGLSEDIKDDDNDLASVTTSTYRHSALIELYEAWVRETNAERIQTLFHECLHLHWAEFTDELGIIMSPLGSAAKQTAEQLMTKREEYIVDDLALAFSRLFIAEHGDEFFDAVDEWAKENNLLQVA